MRRQTWLVAPVDGFEAGYVWDNMSTASTTNPNTRRPRKDGYHNHSQSCVSTSC